MNDNKPVSAYQQLSGILKALKSEEMSITEAMSKIQLKEESQSRPYCKVTTTGALALYGISNKPIVLYPDQWGKLINMAKSNYIENYIKYNNKRLKFKPTDVNYQKKNSDNNSLFNDVDKI
jgi:hypothetical protein